MPFIFDTEVNSALSNSLRKLGEICKRLFTNQNLADVYNHAINSVGEHDEYDPLLVLFCLPELLFMSVIFHLIFSISRDISFPERKQITISLLTWLK